MTASYVHLLTHAKRRMKQHRDAVFSPVHNSYIYDHSYFKELYHNFFIVALLYLLFFICVFYLTLFNLSFHYVCHSFSVDEICHVIENEVTQRNLSGFEFFCLKLIQYTVDSPLSYRQIITGF